LVSQGDAQGVRGTPCECWKHGGSTDGIADLVTRPCTVTDAIMIKGVHGGCLHGLQRDPTRWMGTTAEFHHGTPNVLCVSA